MALQKPYILNKLDTIDTQLADIQTKNNYKVYLENFGGKANDTSVDNSTPLQSAITYLIAHGGGIIQALSGVYTFKTPITVNVPFNSIKLLGVGIYDGAKGTKFDWTGTGYFLTLAQGGQYYEIKDFYLDCHSNYGLLVQHGTQNNFKSRLKDLFIVNALRSITINGFAYYFLENVIIGSSNPSTEYGILIDAFGKTGEFLYFDKCSLDGYSTCNCNALVVNTGTSLYFDKCDIANWGTGNGVLIETTHSETIQNVTIRDTNIIRCDGGINIKATSANITQITIDNPSILFRGTLNSESGITTSRSASYVVDGVVLKALNFRKIGATSPLRVVNIGYNSTNHIIIEIESNLAGGKIYNGDAYNSRYVDTSFGFAKKWSFTGDGTTTTFTRNISADSPFGNNNYPNVIVSTDVSIPFSVSISNTFGGVFSVTVTFSTAPTAGTHYIYAQVSHEVQI